MSEYQYYEFQAVDRRLTDEEMRALRAFSSRAEITPYSFRNVYCWGNFKGDEEVWMEKYFDGFLYYANWGTHILKLRLPHTILDLEVVEPYCEGDCFSVLQSGDTVIVSFLSETEEDGGWEENSLCLDAFLGLRADLIHGDLRCLYLGWLAGFQEDACDEAGFEPPVPPGLQDLNPALIQLADFLRIDVDLISAAAERSLPLECVTPSAQDLQKWLDTLAQEEKESLLREILESSLKGDQTVAIQQIHRFNRAWQASKAGKKEKAKLRTVGELLREAQNVKKSGSNLKRKRLLQNALSDKGCSA